MTGKTVVGVDRDRAILRGMALKIIRTILEKPMKKFKDSRRDWLSPPPLTAFRRLEPLGFGMKEEDWWVFHPDECTPDIVWPLDVGYVCDAAGEEGIFAMSRHYTITAKEARGYASRFSPFMVRHDTAQTDDRCGEMLCAAGILAWIGGKWTDAQKRTLWEGSDAETAIPNRGGALTTGDRSAPMLATSIALRQRYEWAVSLGLEDSPSVRFATDPTGIKEIFRIRDLPPGRDRREALLTWVTDHWRQDRRDADVEVYVRKHMRGTTQFSWRGMAGEILPSQYDVEQRERAEQDRHAMKRTGQDRRAKSPMVGARGFEPLTSCVSSKRSTTELSPRSGAMCHSTPDFLKPGQQLSGQERYDVNVWDCAES